MSRQVEFGLAILILILLPSLVFPTTINVPADQLTIQAGIDAAVDGDTVLVADGTYTGEGNRDIDFLGKAIVVMSENGAEDCIIDCEGSWSDPHRGFIFQNAEDSTSMLRGFTISNGISDWVGGAIYCNYSSPKIIDNRIIGNRADYVGGISISGTDAPIILRENFICGNRGELGCGGVSCDGEKIEITGNVITENYADYDDIFTTDIGGISAVATESIIISHNIIMGNWSHGEAGGIKCSAPTVIMVGNMIMDNRAWGFWWRLDPGHGGGIYCKDSNLILMGNIIADNFSNSVEDYGMGKGAHGGGLFCSNSNFILIGNTITGNIALSSVYEQGQGGGIYCEGSVGTMTNNIFWNNEADIGSEIALADSSSLTINYTDVGGGAPSFHLESGSTITVGQGNIDVDPLFIDPDSSDYHLRFPSPCINTGDPDYVPDSEETDIDGEPRVLRGRIDMGSDEVPYLHYKEAIQVE